MKHILVFVLFLSFTAQSIQAAPGTPSVSGTISQGSEITIGGSAFGSHGNHNEGSYTWNGVTPLAAKFKDFEDGSITSGGWINAYPAQNSIQSGGRIAGGRYLREQYVSDERNQVQYSMAKAPSGSGTIYSTFWFMMPPDTQSGKFWRIYLSGNTEDSPYLSTGCTDRNLRGADNSGIAGHTMYGGVSSFGNNTWHRVEMLMVYSGTSPVVTTWIDGVQQWNANWSSQSSINPNSHTMDFGNMLDRPTATRCPEHPTWSGAYNYDDIYVSYTQARVELCTGSTWANKGTCEVQVPTAWGSSLITARVNTGALAGNSTAYLYVVDSAGDASPASSALTINSSTSNITCYLDADNDLYGDGTSQQVSSCTQNYYEASHFTALTGDCDDTDPTINPGGTDICGVTDRNCDSVIDPCPTNRVRWGTGTIGWGAGSVGQ